MSICLNMIVKNESANIERCLRSVLPFISSWSVADTGSTDDTVDIIEAVLNHIPGEIHSIPFVNFAATRNAALEKCRKSSLAFDYILLMDADMELVTTDPWSLNGLTEPCYQLIQKNVISYYNTRLLRRDEQAHYQGVTHEYLVTSTAAQKLNTASFIDHADGANRPGKFLRDIALLTEALANDPHNHRYQFYLAQSYMDSGNLRLAREEYRRRCGMAGWDEEVWYSMYKIAQLTERIGDTDNMIEGLYLQAYDYRPTRAEPLVELARWHREKSRYSRAFMYATAAASIAKPDDLLFMDDSAYSWRPLDEISISAWYVGAFKEGHIAAESVIWDTKVPDDVRERVANNLKFYKQRAA